LPHLHQLLVAFFEGALVVWAWFTSEFVAGGEVAQMSASERDDAWMPATHDANEGTLGSFRQHARAQPNTTLHAYSAQAQFQKNKTQMFMDSI
jgi:hypothetical protein